MDGVRAREEVLNVALASVLAESGFVAWPETVVTTEQGERRLPDIMVIYRGLRTVIEGKVADVPGAERQVLVDASGRVEEGTAHIAIAVVYPAHLRKIAPEDLHRALREAQLRLSVCAEDGSSGWETGDVAYISELLSRTYTRLAEDNVVTRAANAIERGVDIFAAAARHSPASIDRSAAALGIRELGK